MEITIDHLAPGQTLWRKLAGWLLTLLACSLLAASYMWTGIDPMKLYEKRENAWKYIFGREIEAGDIEAARAQSEKMPEIMANQEARRIVQEIEKETGTALAYQEREQKIKIETEKILSAMPAAEREKMVQSEFERIADEKRGGFFPPETAPAAIGKYLKSLVETVAIALWGTLLAVIASIPASMLAARNTLKIIIPGEGAFHNALRDTVYFGARRFLDFCRGFNEFVMALIFVAVIGLGPFAGVLALAVHTFGYLGKLVSEATEAIDQGPIEGVSASGASSLQTLSFAVIPQIMPLVVSYSLLRFESNVRSATVLGFVGAGGIGFLMYDKINGYMYREVCSMMILVILAVTLIDYGCGRLRKRFI
jgi:phosphonate transport system permease protein